MMMGLLFEYCLAFLMNTRFSLVRPFVAVHIVIVVYAVVIVLVVETVVHVLTVVGLLDENLSNGTWNLP